MELSLEVGVEDTPSKLADAIIDELLRKYKDPDEVETYIKYLVSNLQFYLDCNV